jgi:glycine betaine/proline transport system ATP-binding protein
MTSAEAPPPISLEDVGVVFGAAPNQHWPGIEQRIREHQGKDAIRKATGYTVGLAGITLAIDPGEMFVVMGLSGSGKSTLLRLINRLVAPTAGTVLVGDTDVSALGEADILAFRRQTVSMVFQHFGLLPHRNVTDNIAFPLRVQGCAQIEARARAAEWIGRVGLEGYGSAMPTELSSGMQQRVGLARALVTGAPILLMDEPFGALDPLTRRAMQLELKALQRNLGKTVVLITHDPLEAFTLADRIALLREGQLVQLASPEEMAAAPADEQVSAFVAAARHVP